MPPRKRKAEQVTAAPAAPARVTRSSAKRHAAELPEVKPEMNKAKKGTQKKGKDAEVEDKLIASAKVLDASDKTIVVEHCKQCNAFKTRANLVKEGLEKGVKGITVIINPDKPRRGCFEIRQQGGKKFISLLDMKRPFKPMKDLDMEKVISDIVAEISKTS